MALIYVPGGKAREYSPYALNPYAGGCEHACRYCYCSTIQRAFGRPWTSTPAPRSLSGLAREAANTPRQILMSFMGDPYCPAERVHRNTRKALEVLAAAGCTVAVLTKGGRRCLDDLEAFTRWPDGRVKVGATLTFLSESRSLEEEPGAALPADRLEALAELHGAGVRTWASIEPVLDAEESLAVIEASLQIVDAYKVGRLNHQPSATDWADFGRRAVELIRSAGRPLYVKADLRPHLPVGYLTAAECGMDSLTLPDRPASTTLEMT